MIVLRNLHDLVNIQFASGWLPLKTVPILSSALAHAKPATELRVDIQSQPGIWHLTIPHRLYKVLACKLEKILGSLRTLNLVQSYVNHEQQSIFSSTRGF